jgi:hypothetical protein
MGHKITDALRMKVGFRNEAGVHLQPVGKTNCHQNTLSLSIQNTNGIL